MESRYQILIVGGGNAGISTASQLLKKNSQLDIAILEPSEKHYYQPAWTMVGGGFYDAQKTERPESSVMPEKVNWIKERVTEVFANEQRVETTTGGSYAYDYLIVCPGIQINWDGIEGLKENIGKHNICSVYGYEEAKYVQDVVRKFEGGTALFCSAATPTKCGGAPQKIMYLFADAIRRRGALKATDIHFMNAGKVLFGIEKYRKPLQGACERYGVKQHHRHNLVKIDGENKLATFSVTNENGEITELTKPFDMLHVTPPQSAPKFIEASGLGDEKGWMDVDMHTLQHKIYHNIYGLGDVTNTKNAKTGAAVRKQVPVVVDNLLAQMNGQNIEASYDGYGSCPLLTAKGKVVLAEFDYSGKPKETFPINQGKERWTMYLLKRYVLPWMYWNRILKGKA